MKNVAICASLSGVAAGILFAVSGENLVKVPEISMDHWMWITPGMAAFVALLAIRQVWHYAFGVTRSQQKRVLASYLDRLLEAEGFREESTARARKTFVVYVDNQECPARGSSSLTTTQSFAA